MSADFPFEPDDLSEWMNWSCEEFIIAALNYLRSELGVIHTYTKLIHMDENISSIPQADLRISKNFKKSVDEAKNERMMAFYQEATQGTVGDLTSGILDSVDKISKIVSMAHRYADEQKKLKRHQ